MGALIFIVYSLVRAILKKIPIVSSHLKVEQKKCVDETFSFFFSLENQHPSSTEKVVWAYPQTSSVDLLCEPTTPRNT